MPMKSQDFEKRFLTRKDIFTHDGTGAIRYKRGLIMVWKAFDNLFYMGEFIVDYDKDSEIRMGIPTLYEHHNVTDEREAYLRAIAFLDTFDVSGSIKAIRKDRVPKYEEHHNPNGTGCCQLGPEYYA